MSVIAAACALGLSSCDVHVTFHTANFWCMLGLGVGVQAGLQLALRRQQHCSYAHVAQLSTVKILLVAHRWTNTAAL